MDFEDGKDESLSSREATEEPKGMTLLSALFQKNGTSLAVELSKFLIFFYPFCIASVENRNLQRIVNNTTTNNSFVLFLLILPIYPWCRVVE